VIVSLPAVVRNLYLLFVWGHTPWLVMAWAAVSTLARFGLPAARQRLRAPTMFTVLHVVAIFLVAVLDSADYDPNGAAVAALAFELLAFIGLAQVLVFWIALPRIGVSVPRILVDVVTAIASP